jgi:hypothetical protein
MDNIGNNPIAKLQERAKRHNAYDGQALNQGTVKLAMTRQRLTKAIVHILDVNISLVGLACDCLCPACEEPVMAVRGKMTPHFRHQRHSPCAGGQETALHLWAKDVIQQAGYLWLPPVVEVIGGYEKTLVEGRSITFDTLSVEQPEIDEKTGKRLKPDLLGTYKGQKLYIEVFVTHACDEEKIGKIKERNISTLEINLSSYRKQIMDADALRKAILDFADRIWIHNAAGHKKRNDIIEKYRSIATEAKVAWDKIEMVPEPYPELDDKLVNRFLRAGYGDVINGRFPGDRIFLGAKRWRALLFQKFVRLNSKASFTPIDMIENLESKFPKIVEGWKQYDEPELRQYIQELIPEYHSPKEIVTTFVLQLVKSGYADHFQGTHYRPRKNFLAEEEKAELSLKLSLEAKAAREKKRTEIHDLVAQIKGKSPHENWGNFDQKAWLTSYIAASKQPMDGLNWTIKAMNHLLEDLKGVLRMVSSDNDYFAVYDICGLPIEHVRDRIAAKLKEKEQHEKEARKIQLTEELKNAAVQFGDRADEYLKWLEKPNRVFNGRTPLDKGSDAFSGIEPVINEFNKVLSYQRQFAENMKAMIEKATSAFRIGAISENWLTTSNPQTDGKSPRNYAALSDTNIMNVYRILDDLIRHRNQYLLKYQITMGRANRVLEVLRLAEGDEQRAMLHYRQQKVETNCETEEGFRGCMHYAETLRDRIRPNTRIRRRFRM